MDQPTTNPDLVLEAIQPGDNTIPESLTVIFDANPYQDDNVKHKFVRIGDNAFSSINSIASITLPNTITQIGEAAFQMCTQLTK